MPVFSYNNLFAHKRKRKQECQIHLVSGYYFPLLLFIPKNLMADDSLFLN